MIRISGLTKFFGHQDLFYDVNLTIENKDKIGLIGRNGSGKSTFLKILLGEESGQEGEVSIPEHFRVRALEQHLDFAEDTILAQVIKALPKDAVNEEWRAKSILMGLGFAESDFSRAPKEFSSGFQVRIRLAEALVSDCDLLLLDEPTNYLDILSLRWLSRFLKNWKGGFILVTHDQHFMTEVVGYTVAIHRGRMRKMKGGPAKIMGQIALEEKVYEKTRQNQVKKKAKTEEFISKFRAGARSAGLVQSRIKSLAKQEIGVKLAYLPQIRFHFRSLPFRADSVMEVQDISFSYDDEPLIKSFTLSVMAGDRIGIIGRNGKGKSTLLNLLTDHLQPQEGKIRRNPALQTGYFGSDSKAALSKEKNVLEELVTSAPGVNEQQARNVAASLLFTGDAVKKSISNLSGGEKSRVCFGKVLLHKNHLLALDEPTNHLDMESCQALIESLKEFDGTVIFVTHDEEVLSKVANRLILFDGGRIEVLDMGYDKFLKKVGWSEEEGDPSKALLPTSASKQEYLDRKEAKRQKRMEASKIKKLEKDIETLDRKKLMTAEAFNQACLDKDVEQIRVLGLELKDIDDQIDEAYEALEALI